MIGPKYASGASRLPRVKISFNTKIEKNCFFQNIVNTKKLFIRTLKLRKTITNCYLYLNFSISILLPYEFTKLLMRLQYIEIKIP